MDYVLYFVLLVAVGIYVFHFLNTFTYYLQLNGYNVAKNIKTLVSKTSLEIVLIYLSPACVSVVINLLLIKSKILWLFLLIETLAFFALIFVLNVGKVERKVKLKVTKRYLRAYILSLLISVAAVSYFCYIVIFKFKHIFGIVYLTPIIVLLSTCISCILLIPVESIINGYYIAKASRTLKLHGGIVNIAITGSYGKTSTKYMLKTILSKKYDTLATPDSYNTPLGIAKTINQLLTPSNDVFIMEFGANHKGDIKYLCKKFRPNIALITAIGKAHLNTFKSVDNIIKTKFELLDNLYGNKKLAFVNLDNELIKQNIGKYKQKVIKCGVSSADMTAKNIIESPNGLTFDVYVGHEKYVSLHTKLTGLHNVNNILLCIAVAIKLNLSKQQIIEGVAELAPVRARMEKIPHSSGAVIINDGYNSNPYSARCAIDSMNCYGKLHKLVLTPGMVELGKYQYKENYDLGLYMAQKVDRVYIANKVNERALTRGLIDGGMALTNIKTNCNLSDTLKQLTSNDILLIENDLPDNYI